MRSFFPKRNAGAQQSRKRKQAAEATTEGVPTAFEGDEDLLQLHAETAELLRLVKTSAKPVKKSSNAASAPKARLTIEVLDDGDDDEEAQDNTKTAAGKQDGGLPLREQVQPVQVVDPSAFDAEEARIRQARDTFYPSTRPTKHGVEWQLNVFQREQSRQEEMKHTDRRRAEQTKRSKERGRQQTLENRLETSAVLIQAHSRGFLCRRRRRQVANTAEAAAPSIATASASAESEANQWHEVRDVERGEVWYYNATTGQSQWEPPPTGFSSPPAAPSLSETTTTRSLPALPSLNASGGSTLSRSTPQRSSSGLGASESLPPLSPACSSARSVSSDHQQRPSSRHSDETSPTKKMVRSPRSLPVLQPEQVVSSPNPWDCDSVLPSERSVFSELPQDVSTPGGYEDSDAGESPLFRRRRSLELELDGERDDDDDDGSDWQTNDSLFRADGSKNSKLRDTIRSALQVSKFDSISSLIASNVVLRRRSVPGRRSHNQVAPATPGSRRREIVLGKRAEPVLVAVVTQDRDQRISRTKGSTGKSKTASSVGRPPRIRDLADPGFHEDSPRKSPTSRQQRLGKDSRQQQDGENAGDLDDPEAAEAARRRAESVCFNCWSASNGQQCDLHRDPKDATRKVRAAESALMCANWELDQLRRKYRAEEIQEIFMKQRASLRYDRQLKQYVTIIECRHPIYRALEQLASSWNKTMRRKLHTRAWFRSFLELLRAGRLPHSLGGGKGGANGSPSLFKLKNTLQNTRWCTKYSESVSTFHPKAPVTAKDRSGQHAAPKRDVIMIHPARPQLRHWVLVTEYTIPIALFKPRVYELPPPRCVPMPAPSFLERLPLPVPNVHIDAGHRASWLERLSARMTIAALQKAALQIGACTPPHGSTDARRTKLVRPLVVLFATFSRKPTPGNLAVGGLSAELIIHMLVTTYVPAQFGNFVVFDRRAVAPAPSHNETATFVCLVVDATAPEFVFRALEHALNVRRPPCIVVAARVHYRGSTAGGDQLEGELQLLEARRFPLNRPEQTGEEEAHGFRTFWLVDAFVVPDDVPGVQVAPTSAILAPNVASMNATVTTRVDRTYPFCVPTTRENTPIEFIHLLWIGQSSRNQPQVFTTLGRQQPGDFMKNSDPNGALGACSSVVYRSWAYMQDSPFDEFVTADGVAYWYDRNTGDTFWIRPILPVEKHRGKDGDVDGVITVGEGEVATLGVGVGNGGSDSDAAEDGGAARYSQQNLRKYMTKKMEAPEEKERRLKLVTASAKKHDIVLQLASDDDEVSNSPSVNKGDLTRIQVPRLSLQQQQQRRSILGSRASSASSTKSRHVAGAMTQEPLGSDAEGMQSLDLNTKQMIDSITQALGSALPALSQGNSIAGTGGSVDMLQLGIGLGMGLSLRVQQQNGSPTRLSQRGHRLPSTRSEQSRKLEPSYRSHSAEDLDEQDEEDEESEPGSSRSEASSVGTSLLSSRSGVSIAPSVDISPSPDEAEQHGGPHLGKKTPGYQTHPAPGEGTSWVHKPVDASAESQTAVEGFGGALHQRVACLPKDFVAAVTRTKTCQMQANYLPIIKNMNQPRSVGIVRPRGALEEWLVVGYSPWTAGRAVFGTQLIEDLMLRPELIQQNTSAAAASSSSAGAVKAAAPTATAAVHMEKRDNVSQAVKENEQLEAILSLCRHGKYDQVELLLNSPDWTIGIEAKDATGNTLLSVACQNNNKRIAKLCMRRGADINTQNVNGQSVLHYCHEYGFHDLMEYLMEKGAKDDLLNADGLTCYEGLTQEAVDAI